MKLFITVIFLSISLLNVYASDYKQTELLLEADKTIIGETIHYPGGTKANIKSIVVVMKPGEKTEVHKHGVPLYAYMLSGKLEVDYGEYGKKIYRTGDNFMEAMGQFHQGTNIGSDNVKILAVFMGGNAQSLVIKKRGCSP